MKKLNLTLILVIGIAGCATLQSVKQDFATQIVLANTAGEITGLIYAKEIDDATAVRQTAVILTNLSSQLIQGENLSESEKEILENLTLRDAVLCLSISAILSEIDLSEENRLIISTYSISAAEAMLQAVEETKR